MEPRVDGVVFCISYYTFNSYDIQVPAQSLATFEARFVLTNFRQLI